MLLAHDFGAGATSGGAATPGFGCAGGTSGALKRNTNPLFQIFCLNKLNVVFKVNFCTTILATYLLTDAASTKAFPLQHPFK